MASAPRSTISAAGCLVWRYGSNEPEVVLVHRPRWNDWSLPKGKLDRGELPAAAAVREVEEETGLHVRLGPRLHDQHYVVMSGQPKVVHYWAAEPPKKADITRYSPNEEIDEVVWVPLSRARDLLTHPRDVDLLDELTVSAYDSTVLLVVRHAESRKRKTWRRSDTERPLAAAGRRTAEALVPVLAAYGISRVVSSDALRCTQTMTPYVNAYGVKVRLESGLSEERASKKKLARIAARCLDSSKRMALCTHRPVLPDLCAALGIEATELDPGGMLVIHRNAGKILSVEKPG